MLGRDVVVLEPAPLVVGAVEHARERRGDVRLLLPALRGRERGELLLGVRAQRAPVGEELLVEQSQQQVVGRDLGIAPPARELLRGSDRLLRLDRQLVEVHVSSVLGRSLSAPHDSGCHAGHCARRGTGSSVGR